MALNHEEQVMESMQHMACSVDEQNAQCRTCSPMAPNFSGVAVKSAYSLVRQGFTQTNDYTKPLLHAYKEANKGLQKTYKKLKKD